MQQVSNQSRH